ncbi:MAG: hypothetical protein WBV70_06540 [Candidatus Bathyarchaeia archaeon]
MASLEHLQDGRYAVLKKLGEAGKSVVLEVRDMVLSQSKCRRLRRARWLQGNSCHGD